MNRRVILVAFIVTLIRVCLIELLAQDATPSATVAATKHTVRDAPGSRSDNPGKCPKCGMTLVPMKSKSKVSPSPSAHASNEMQSGSHHDMDLPMHRMSMQSPISVADPMSRESSGTAWVPDSTPMYGKMLMFGDNMLMLHGGAFPSLHQRDHGARRRSDLYAELVHGHVFASDWAQRAARKAAG